MTQIFLFWASTYLNDRSPVNAICLVCVIFCPFKLLWTIHVNSSPIPQGISLLDGGVFLSFYTALVHLLSISGIASDTHKGRLQRARFTVGIMRSLGLNLMQRLEAVHRKTGKQSQHFPFFVLPFTHCGQTHNMPHSSRFHWRVSS